MTRQEIAIRCTVSPNKGFGNFNRCLILGEELREKKYKILFIIDENPQIIRELIKRKFQYNIISKFRSRNKEALFMVKLLNKKNLKFLILDAREKGEALSKKISTSDVQVFLLDDAWVNEAWANIIINGTMIKKYQKYKKLNQNSKIFLGTKYFIIDKNFLKNKKMFKDIKQKSKYCIVVSLGGSDPHGLTFKILDSICDLGNIDIRVILGPLVKQKIKRLEYKRKNVSFIESPKLIWNEFKKADLVISNAGNTLFELAVQKVPTICIPAIEHQVPYARFFQTNGFGINLGLWNNVKNKDVKNTVNKILSDLALRKKMHSQGDKIIDGKGLFRVIQIIESHIKRTNR
jgi:spore coat polysaccharide biosynthesis predicted glycosyltransferase SpsG